MKTRQAAVCGAALFAAVAMAFWVRYQFVLLYGGHADDYLAWADVNYFGGISRFYVDTARGLAGGQAYPTLAYPPGYPFILSLIVRAGQPGANAMRLLQIALDCLGVLALFALLRIGQWSAASATAGAWVYALHPLLATGAVFLLGEALSPLFLVVVLLAVARAARGGAIWWLAAGAVTGSAILVRPDLLVLAAGLTLFAAVTGHDRVRQVVLFVSGAMMVLGPWAVRNRVQEGVWVMTSSSTGAALYEGLGDIPNPYGYISDDSATNQLLKRQGITTGAGSPRGNQQLEREYLSATMAHPWHVIRAVGERWRRILFTSEQLQPLYFPRARAVADAAGFLLVIAALILARRNHLQTLIVAAPLVSALFGIGLTHFEPRYVRYAQLSYIFAALIVADYLVNELRCRLSNVVIMSAGTAAIVLVALYCMKQLAELHRDAQALFS